MLFLFTVTRVIYDIYSFFQEVFIGAQRKFGRKKQGRSAIYDSISVISLVYVGLILGTCAISLISRLNISI